MRSNRRSRGDKPRQERPILFHFDSPRANYAATTDVRREFTASDCAAEVNARLYTYWSELPKDGRFPPRSAFDPIDVPYALGNIAVFEIHRDPARFRYRLVCTRLVERDGYDLTGRWVDELRDPDYAATIEGRIRLIRDDPGPLLVRTEWVSVHSHRLYDYEALWLPFAPDKRRPYDSLMCCQIHL